MDSIEFFQVFIIIIILIITLFCIYNQMDLCSFLNQEVVDRNMNSSSSPPPPPAAPALKDKYDVFLSFKVHDTRFGFTSHLHKALLRKQIETYIDDERLEKGNDIEPSLLKAIERSKIALVIFSKNYASSTWCLKELVHILKCKKSSGQIVIPIFYHIDPSHVRKQQDEVANWRATLEEAANMSGFHYSSKTGSEADFVEKVVQDIWTKLNRESSSDLKGLFGIERKIGEIESLLCLDSPGVCCVGIWGMGGIGKTTLADAVFHKLSSKFEVCCFLKDVREKSEKTDGLHQLRNKLVGEILKGQDINIDTPSIPDHIQDRLRSTKALIVLDDVNARKQLEDLVGDRDHERFCPGSRIIITTRDKGLLEQKGDVKIFNVEGLGSDDALRLFRWHAFGSKSPSADNNTDLSREVVEYIKGIPLALKVMGSLFRRCKSKQEWEVQWEKVKQVPIGEVQKVLRVSYDGLEDNEKEIFLDIACFHKDYERNYVKEFLDSRGFPGEAGINDLIDMSLISISHGRWIEMHDLVQQMGRAIARQQRIEKRSRLFNAEEYVYQVLKNNQRNGHVEAISFNSFKFEALELEPVHFKNTYQLRCLRVHGENCPVIVSLDLPNSLRYLEWNKYPMKSLPSKFSAQNLLVLLLSASRVGPRLWNEDQSPLNLKWIDLHFSKYLNEVPNLSRCQKIEHIDLSYCESLVEIPLYFQRLGELTYLHLGHCTKLKKLPEMPWNLEFLDLSSTAIEELPSSVWSHEKISHLDITFCRHLKSLPSNSCKLKLSSSLSLEGCDSLCEFWELPMNTRVLDLTRMSSTSSNLVSLPTNIWKLKSLESLILNWRFNFQYLPEISEAMEHLEFLHLAGTAVKELPPSIGNLVVLRKLDLSYCKNLESLPELPSSLESLDLNWCSKFQNFPEISEPVEHLKFLNLSSTAVKELPPSIGNLVALRGLYLVDCKQLVSLPVNIWKLKYLESLDLSQCSKFQNFPEISEAMEYLEFLKLSCTAVKELPPSIGNLVALRKLDLSPCKNLVSLPTNIWKLKYLESLDLSWCSNFQNFPEISEAMEYLEFLKLSGTAVKELPPSIGNLVALQKLDLSHCKNLVSLPTNIWKLKYLERLDLSRCSKFQNFPEISEAMEHLKFLNLSSTTVKEVPPSIGNLVALRKLDLSQCKSLESLPELPPLLECLDAHGCTSLKTVSSSSTAITQGWEEYIFSRGLYEKHIFSDCPKLDENARSNILADAQLRIMRMATASSKFKEDKIEAKIEKIPISAFSDDEYESADEYGAHKEFFDQRSMVAIRCLGYEIPKWISHQSEGSSIKIDLPRDWFSTDFLGFALSIAYKRYAELQLRIRCKYNFKTNDGESHEVNRDFFYVFGSLEESSLEVFVSWYNIFEEVVEGAPSLTAFYNRFTEVNVDFIVLTYDDTEGKDEEEEEEEEVVEKCGIYLLYGKDGEKIKQRALSGQDA